MFAQHLPAFGWEPVILTVHEKYYEETLDWNLYRLLPPGQRIEKVKAFAVTRPRLIGDIGLRGFLQLRKRAIEIIQNEKIDFVYLPVPSFYTSLIGPYIFSKTGIKYGIDYIDPWVHNFPGSDKLLSRHWWSTRIARWLEPKAVKRASLITGVAEGYYDGTIKRNPSLKGRCVFGAMPYGGEKADHEKVRELALKPYLFQKDEARIQLVYAGAMLPKAYAPLEAIFQSIAAHQQLYRDVAFYFIGTGKTPNDPMGYNIKSLAEKYGLWQTIVFEFPARIPYLDVLTHLEAADGVFILGSTEPHYTPSKAYQAVLAKKPVMAVLHGESTAVEMLRSANAGLVLSFQGEKEIGKIRDGFYDFFNQYLLFIREFRADQIKFDSFDAYSARAVTQRLSELLEAAV